MLAFLESLGVIFFLALLSVGKERSSLKMILFCKVSCQVLEKKVVLNFWWQMKFAFWPVFFFCILHFIFTPSYKWYISCTILSSTRLFKLRVHNVSKKHYWHKSILSNRTLTRKTKLFKHTKKATNNTKLASFKRCGHHHHWLLTPNHTC